MKNKFFFLLAVVFIAAMIFPTSAYAYTRVQGSVIDSLNLVGWAHGGEVWVFDSAGNICGTGVLGIAEPNTGVLMGGNPLTPGIDITSGNFDDNLGQRTGDCTGPTTVLVDFTCGMGVASCTAPVSNPGTYTVDFAQNPLPIPFNAGFIETGTGPNAIELVDFSVTPQASGNTWLPFVLLIGSVALVSGAVAVIRKRKA